MLPSLGGLPAKSTNCPRPITRQFVVPKAVFAFMNKPSRRRFLSGRRSYRESIVIDVQPFDRIAKAADVYPSIAVLAAVIFADVETNDVVGQTKRRRAEIVDEITGA